MKKSIAIIPARGGSKRLPRKNILPFMGKPMFLWTYEAALNTQLFDTIILSTEDEEIASMAKKYNIEVHIRPKHLATDEAGCVQVCAHVLSELSKQGRDFESLCCLYATAPLRNANDIRQTMMLLEAPVKAQFSFATCHYSHPVHQAMLADSTGALHDLLPLSSHMKSQHVPEIVIDNGSTYCVKVDTFLKYKSFKGAHSFGYVMPRMRSVDIDTQEDFDIALCYAEYLTNKEK